MKKIDRNLIIIVAGTLLAFIMILIAFVYFTFVVNNGSGTVNVYDFETCVAAGNPVMESYPEQCMHNGRTYTRVLSPEEQKNLYPSGEITIEPEESRNEPVTDPGFWGPMYDR